MRAHTRTRRSAALSSMRSNCGSCHTRKCTRQCQACGISVQTKAISAPSSSQTCDWCGLPICRMASTCPSHTCRCPSCATRCVRARASVPALASRGVLEALTGIGDAPPARTSRQESKFGMAIVVKTTKRSGSYTLGFSVTPAERLSSVFKEIEMLHATYSQVARASWRTILAALHARACDTAAADMARHASDARARARGRAWLAHACRTPSSESTLKWRTRSRALLRSRCRGKRTTSSSRTRRCVHQSVSKRARARSYVGVCVCVPTVCVLARALLALSHLEMRAAEQVSDALAAYYADGDGGAGDGAEQPAPVVHPVLGLAVEPPPQGVTIEQLWSAV